MPHPRIRAIWLVLLAGCFGSLTARADPGADGDHVTALGRLEPRGGPVRVAGPSEMVAVVAELRVEEGDLVEEGQLLALLDRHALRSAIVRQREAELALAEQELARASRLTSGRAGAEARREDAEASVRAARAVLEAARAQLELALVRAPIAGRVLEVNARAGERVGEAGVLEIGRTEEMFAVAEVYETEIGQVAVGQRALVSSPALPTPLEGTVERIGLKVGRLDVVGADPIAKTDARVVEVDIRLDEGERVSHLTNLQVEVSIHR
jgi:HlyD family secretion protein